MRNIIVLFIIILFSNLLIGQEWQYANNFGGTSLYENRPYNLVLDDYGNSYIFGNYGADAEFNGNTLPHFDDNYCGSYLAKFDCNGNILWAKTVANAHNNADVASYMIIKDDILYLSGTCEISMNATTYFLDTVINTSPSNYPENPVYPWIVNNNYTYLIKYDLNGNIIDYDLFHLKSTTEIGEESKDLLWSPIFRLPFHIDSDGNLYLLTTLGYNSPSILCINNNEVTELLPAVNFYFPMYVIKCDSNLNFLWIKPLYQELSDPLSHKLQTNILDIVSDSENNLYIAGYIVSNSIGGAFYNTPTSIKINDNNILHTYKKGDYVSVLIKMDENGNILWAEQTTSYNEYTTVTMSQSRFESLVIDEETNNIFIGGNAMCKTPNQPLLSTVFDDHDTLVCFFQNEYSSPYTGIIANYDLDGNYKWAKSINSYKSDLGYLELYESALYAGCEWRTELSFGNQSFSHDIWDYNFSILKWDLNGNPISLIETSDVGNQNLIIQSYGLKHSINGDIIINGIFKDNFNIGSFLLSNPDFKMFIAKYGSQCPIYTEETQTFCYGQEYLGTTFTNSGQYMIVTQSSNPDTDSIICINANVLPLLSTEIPDTVLCTNELHTLYSTDVYDTYQWSTGSETFYEDLMYSEEGQFFVYVTLTNAECEGIDTIIIKTEICEEIEPIQINRLEIYPKPTNSLLNISLPNDENIKNISIYSYTGTLISKIHVASKSSITIQVDDLATGMYFIIAKSNHSYYSGFFIKE